MREAILEGSSLLQFFVRWVFYIGITLLHLVAAEVVFIADFRKRKPLFLARAVLAAVGVVALSLPLLLIILLAGQRLWSYSAVYLLTYFLTVAGVWFCCEEPLLKIAFCCAGAQCLQNMTSRLMRVIFLHWPASDMETLVVQNLLSLAVMTLVYVAVDYVVLRRTRDNMYMKLESGGAILFVFFALLVTVILSSACDLYITDAVALLLCNLLFIFLCLTILFVQVGIFDRGKLNEEKAVLAAIDAKERAQLDFSRENLELINRKCHDARHMIHAMRSGGAGVTGQFWDELEYAVQIYDDSVKTGNKAVDVILREKSLYCREHGIDLSCMFDGSMLSYMSDVDLYSLFGNAVENAIEAVMELPREERNISIVQQEMGDNMILLQIRNPYRGEVRLEGEYPVTKKPDKGNHGFGVRSIRRTVEKYGGEVCFDTSGGVFDLRLILLKK